MGLLSHLGWPGREQVQMLGCLVRKAWRRAVVLLKGLSRLLAQTAAQLGKMLPLKLCVAWLSVMRLFPCTAAILGQAVERRYKEEAVGLLPLLAAQELVISAMAAQELVISAMAAQELVKLAMAAQGFVMLATPVVSWVVLRVGMRVLAASLFQGSLGWLLQPLKGCQGLLNQAIYLLQHALSNRMLLAVAKESWENRFL